MDGYHGKKRVSFQDDVHSDGNPTPRPSLSESVNSARPSALNDIDTVKVDLDNAFDKFPHVPLNNFKFLETRRRSHAFSISALDESNQLDYDQDYDADDGGHGRRSVAPENGLAYRHSRGEHDGKVYRAQELPCSDAKTQGLALLVHSRNRIVPAKSFIDELHSFKDVELFLDDSKVMLDIDENTLSGVLNKMLLVSLFIR